jgi:hypothetical protein
VLLAVDGALDPCHGALLSGRWREGWEKRTVVEEKVRRPRGRASS